MLSQAIAKRLLRNVAMFAFASPFCLTGCAGGDPPRGFLALQPLGKVDDKLLALMSRFVETAYASSCKVIKPLDLPSTAYDPTRKQYRADKLLSFLRDNSPAGALKVIGLTEEDIYTSRMNFIFGLADLRGQFCVVSTCRLHESFWRKPEKQSLLYRRALKVLYHELGHTFGIPHCNKLSCAMCYHNSVPELDASYVWFCPECTRQLQKRLGTFPKDREAKLAALLTELDFVTDAQLYTKGRKSE